MGKIIPVFLLMIFNRETALFVPLWLLIRGFLDRDRRTMSTAGLMGIAGVIVTLAWRTIRVTARGRENEFRGVLETMSVAAALALAIPVVGYIGELRLFLPVAPLLIFSFVSLRANPLGMRAIL